MFPFVFFIDTPYSTQQPRTKALVSVHSCTDCLLTSELNSWKSLKGRWADKETRLSQSLPVLAFN